MSRNHYMMLGTALLLLGVTIFKVENVTLNQESTTLIAQQAAEDGALLPVPTASRKTFPVPPWLRFSLISVGAILMLHAVAMKPGG